MTGRVDRPVPERGGGPCYGCLARRRQWQKALDGIRLAIAEGCRVRVAATAAGEITVFDRLLDGLDIPRDDQLVRPGAHPGFAAEGLVRTVEVLLLEVTVTADGVYWHPVAAADHPDQLVTTTAVSSRRGPPPFRRVPSHRPSRTLPCV